MSDDDATCPCDREPAWCFVHRRWGRRTSSPPTRTELVERVRDLTATVEAQAADIATAVARADAAESERDAVRDAAMEYLDARAAYDVANAYDATNADDERRAWDRRAAAQGALAALVGVTP